MPDPIDTDDLPDTERLRLNRDGYLEPWPDGMLCYYAHFKTVVSDLRADLSALRAREAEMRAALTEIANITERKKSCFPDDWREQIAACAECQRYKHHPIQQGICDDHRKPIYAQQDHDTHETKILGYRAQSIARAALSQPDSGEGA
ncbi:hypothetical protein [Paracoccus sp. 22332]|uniref:hypothetical protein n=1 Tax=Paracoccus sp. 22332 TaxID=3453913 RepID=UPI003F824E26